MKIGANNDFDSIKVKHERVEGTQKKKHIIHILVLFH